MKKILIVDDEKGIREVLKEYAEFEGYEVVEAADGMEAIQIISREDIDVIIMDIMMPKLDGFSAVKKIKSIKNIPVLIVSARGEEYDKLFGFELGIDDYVVKPFSPREVMARIHAVLMRQKEPQNQIQNYNGLQIDIAGHEVSIDGKPLSLTPKEYELLFYLVKHKNLAVSRSTLLSEVWGYDFYGDDRTVDTHIKMLRHSLGRYRNHIITLRGVGYKFIEADAESNALKTAER